MRTSDRTPWQRAAETARRQHGVITFEQLLAAGAGRDQVKRWVARGLLHRVHLGVYRLGHVAPSTDATYLAAVLACGEGALLAGFAAAHHLDALRGNPAPEVLSSGEHVVRGVTVHRSRHPADADRWMHRGVPVTSPARTIVDLAGRMELGALAEVAHRLGVRWRMGAEDVQAVVARRGWVSGAAKLRAIYEGDAEVLLSRLERDFMELLRSAGLPLPQTNRRAGSFYVDCRWPGFRLTVELLGFRFHGSRHAWTQDQRRAREAYARGDEFRAYTWDDVHATPSVVLRELGPLLAADRAA